MSSLQRGTLIAAAVLLLAMTATPANNAEEVIFSTPGSVMTLTGNSKAAATGFGFWIWCSGGGAPGSKGGYQNADACQGNMYFYALDSHATPIVGFMTEGPDGFYTQHVLQGTFAQLKSGNLNPSFSCILQNTTLIPKGSANATVHVECGTPATAYPPFGIPVIPFSPALGGGSGIADVTNAVTNVTGP